MTEAVGKAKKTKKTMGRPLATTPSIISSHALDLFENLGFENVTMDMIAKEVGISRRTLFRYFPTKSDLLWEGVRGFTKSLEERLNNPLPGETVQDTIVNALMTVLDQPDETVEKLRWRLRLIGQNIDQISAVQTQYSMRYHVLLDFMERSGVEKHAGTCELLAKLIIGGALNAFIWWSQHDNLDLRRTLNYPLDTLGTLKNIPSV